MECRNGSNTGIGVRLRPDSDNILIYLEGGGACFNAGTCLANPSFFGKIQFDSWANTGLQSGIHNKRDDDNPFRDWNMIYIPYCTGDVHSGTNTSADIDIGFNNLNMVGYNNVTLALNAIQMYMEDRDLEEVFLTGSSAGGFGTLTNASQVAEIFSGAKLTVLDDSGPVQMNQEAQPDCLDENWAEMWQWHVPDDFAAFTTGAQSTHVKNLYEYLATKHPDVEFGLISSLEDDIIRAFYGYGENDCDPPLDVAVKVTAEAYRSGLIHLRDSVLSEFPNWHTYYVDNASHTFNALPGTFKTLEVEGVLFRDWVNDLREREAVNVPE